MGRKFPSSGFARTFLIITIILPIPGSTLRNSPTNLCPEKKHIRLHILTFGVCPGLEPKMVVIPAAAGWFDILDQFSCSYLRAG